MFHGFRFFAGRARRRVLAAMIAAAPQPTVVLLEKSYSRDEGVWLREEIDALVASGATIFRSQGSMIALAKLPDERFIYRVLGHEDFTQSTVPIKGGKMAEMAWAA